MTSMQCQSSIVCRVQRSHGRCWSIWPVAGYFQMHAGTSSQQCSIALREPCVRLFRFQCVGICLIDLRSCVSYSNHCVSTEMLRVLTVARNRQLQSVARIKMS